jgi:hypothetical protein
MDRKEIRNFELRDAAGNVCGVYKGRSPRQAALKAANAGFEQFSLREKGTKKLHLFTGERKQVPKPTNAPEWMQGDMIWKPNVKKIGIQRM